MPKIYEYFGFVFFFYSNEHLPIHVHISVGEFESKIELVYLNGKLRNVVVGTVKGRNPLPVKALKEAIRFVEKYHEGIVKKWTIFFVKNKKVLCEVINEKV